MVDGRCFNSLSSSCSQSMAAMYPCALYRASNHRSMASTFSGVRYHCQDFACVDFHAQISLPPDRKSVSVSRHRPTPGASSRSTGLRSVPLLRVYPCHSFAAIGVVHTSATDMSVYFLRIDGHLPSNGHPGPVSLARANALRMGVWRVHKASMDRSIA